MGSAMKQGDEMTRRSGGAPEGAKTVEDTEAAAEARLAAQRPTVRIEEGPEGPVRGAGEASLEEQPTLVLPPVTKLDLQELEWRLRAEFTVITDGLWREMETLEDDVLHGLEVQEVMDALGRIEEKIPGVSRPAAWEIWLGALGGATLIVLALWAFRALMLAPSPIRWPF
jgi:hypothetical protein